MPESNEPQQLPEGKTVYRPASPDTEDIPLADAEAPPEPKPDPVNPQAPPPEPPDEPIDEGSVALTD